jgi:hypothetical protein
VPGLIGALAHHLSLEVVGPALLTTALVLLVLYEALPATRPRKVQTLQALP